MPAVVPAELTCWAVLDPETAVISAMVNGPVAIPAEHEPRLAAAEVAACTPPGGPLGLDQQVRVVFSSPCGPRSRAGPWHLAERSP